MTANELLDELFRLQTARKIAQGELNLEILEGIVAVSRELRLVADEYDALERVPLCPNRENPDHFKINCWQCDHEGQLLPQVKMSESSHLTRQLDMFDKEDK
jgi:hypothetical protein